MTKKKVENDIEDMDLSFMKESRQKMSAPWSDAAYCSAPTNVEEFVAERSRVHETYIVEQAKSRRFGLLLAFLLILAAAAAVMFAPEGRQSLSYWIGAALLVFAAGASGFGRVWGKTATFEFSVDRGVQKPNQ